MIYKIIYEKYEYDVSDHLPLTKINMKHFLEDHSYNISRNIPKWQMQILITYKTIGTLVKIY